MLKNAIKILFCNITSTWKVLLYKLLVVICTLGLTTVLIMPIIDVLIKENFFQTIGQTVNNLTFNMNLQNVFLGIQELLQSFWLIISQNNLSGFTIFSAIVLVILYYFCSGLYKLALTDSLNAYMSSYTKSGFLNSYVANIKKGSLLSLLKVGIVLPFDILIIGLCVLIFQVLSKTSAIATLIVVVLIVVLFALKHTLFCGWETAIATHNCGVFEGLKRSFKIVKRKFLKIFSDNLLIMLFVFVFDMFMIFFTVGAGLIVTLPLTSVFVTTYSNVAYYECSGMRYYLDSNNICTPRKLEETDNFKKVQNII